MNIDFVKGNVFEMKADALVFSANKEPIIGGSLDAFIYEKAGKDQLLEKRKAFGTIKSGKACITESCGLSGYKWLIHAVCPVYQKNHPTSTTHTLKQCYLSALALANEKGLESVNFALLGAGAKGFSHRRAKVAAEEAVEKYLAENPDSSVKYVTIIEYEKEDEYQALLECNDCLKRLYDLLPKINGGEQFLEQNSELGSIKKAVVDKLTEYTLTETQQFRQRYEADKQKYNNTHSADDLTFEDHIYSQLVVRPKNTTNIDFAVLIYISSATEVSRIFNYLRKRYNQTSSFLSIRMNVLKLSLGLELSYENTCRLMWSQGHDFPSSDMDYDIVNNYIIIGDQSYALEDYANVFQSAKSKNAEEKSEEK